DQRFEDRFKSSIINFNSDTAAVETGGITPVTYAGMMTAQQVVQHMMYRAILTNHIVSTHLCPFFGTCPDGLLTTVLSRMMYNHKIGAAYAEISCAHPGSGIGKTCRVFYGVFTQQFCIRLSLLFIH